ncbi:nuclear transport factor 2 family protein [Marinomonas spartinae]|uniref:nuclear transport factor 2 family protein n=1 Tax=Marinomonas spartinae TaxID=1792290 RepID=UPI0018F19A67|nr:nuclear transport factor 2 family protein [Marinomonas spartinae]MBJ7556167.1 nuclear transport factor 2 family protein [Marinomonas spartinae]
MKPQQVLKSYELALASQDWCLVEPLMHKNVCVTFSNGTFKGIEEVRTVFEENFSSIKDEQYSISKAHWAHISETEAVCLYCFSWKGIIEGEHCSGSGRGTTVLINENGCWQIITEHLGPNES